MPHNFLQSNKFVNLSELSYLLLNVLDRKNSIPWEELSKLCKEHSLNFLIAFENTLLFLHELAIVKIQEDRSVIRNSAAGLESVKTNEALSAFILNACFKFLEAKKMLKTLINNNTLSVNQATNGLILHTTSLQADYPFIKSFLLNMQIVRMSPTSNDDLIIQQEFHPAFKKLLTNSIIDPKTKPSFFISYSHKDEPYKQDLQNHFSGLVNKGLIQSWDGGAIMPGADWEEEVKKNLDQAEFVLFLISADFMASDYINRVEIQRAIERHERKEVTIIPIILRTCDFKSLPIGSFQALPTGARAINTWEDKDEAYYNIVTQIKKILENRKSAGA